MLTARSLVNFLKPFRTGERSHLSRLIREYRAAHGEYSKAEEIRIPVSYGHISGKVWGEPDGKPILGLHGWLDNAATFDRIAPLLPSGYRFVCIDHPGHGRSSHYPPGIYYKMSDSFTFIHMVIEHMKWDKCCIIGHSLGGGMGSWYSALFPDIVEKLVSIDLISFGAMPLQNHVKTSRKAVLESVKIRKKMTSGKVPEYTFEDACGRAFMAANIMHGLGALTKESVELLMSRGLVKTENDMYTWASDLRLRIPITFNMVQEVIEEYASNIRCPHLLVKATDSTKFMTDDNFDRLLKVYSHHNPNFAYIQVEGGHHLHLNTPELVSPIINQFLEKKIDGNVSK